MKNPNASGAQHTERNLLFAGLAGLAALAGACMDELTTGEDTPTETVDAAAPSEEGACELSPSTLPHTKRVVAAAEALLAALTPEQRAAVQYEHTLDNVIRWSNFPTTVVTRNGVPLLDMDDAAQTAAIALAELAAGQKGATLLSELRLADDFLIVDAGESADMFGAGRYFFSFHGVPSVDAAWMLQIGGHHLAYNFSYGTPCTSATPLFEGVEPPTWTDTEGQEHAPLASQHTSVRALLAAVGEAPEALLEGTYSDIINGPNGGFDGGIAGDAKYDEELTYPTGTTGRGLSVGSLSEAEQELVKAAMEAWVKNVADPVSEALLAEYESDAALAQTYIGYSGSADLSTEESYFRIDGPRVWIELSVQAGASYRDQGLVHYHTVWRDKVADYGAEFRSQ